jgi:hypothetical protein
MRRYRERDSGGAAIGIVKSSKMEVALGRSEGIDSIAA